MKRYYTECACDFCGDKIEGDHIETSGVDYGGCSDISFKGKSFTVGEQDYCNSECLFNDIKRHLFGDGT